MLGVIEEEAKVEQDRDSSMDLKDLSRYSGLSVRSLRAYLTDPAHPLPHFRMKEPHLIRTRDGRRRTVSGKILVAKDDFLKWREHFRYQPDVDRIVDEVVGEILR